MDLDVQSLKMAHLCSILLNKQWEYKKETQTEILIKDLIHAAVCWLGRRESHMAWDTLEAMAGFQTASLEPQVAADVHARLKVFYHDQYKKMTSPLGRHPLKINLDGTTLEGVVPVIAYKDADKVTKKHIEFILFENTDSKHLFMKNVLVRLISVWTPRIKDRFRIVNLNLETGSIIEFEPTGQYIENSREVLRSMIKFKPKRGLYPSEEICMQCPHLEVCPI